MYGLYATADITSSDRKMLVAADTLIQSGFTDDNGVSLGYCAEIAGMSKQQFIKYLGENNVSIFKFDDDEEFLEELNNA